MQIQTLHEVDHADVAALMSTQFGARGDELELLATWKGEPHRFVRIAVINGQVAGLTVAPLCPAFDTSAYERDFEVCLDAYQPPFATVNQMVVDPAFRRLGVAKALAAAAAQWVSQQRIQTVFGVSWSHGGPHHSGHLFDRAGFTLLGSCKGFYRQFQDATGQPCTVCGPALCTCTALLYALETP